MLFMLKKLLKDTAVYSVATIAAKGIGFFLIPVYTRLLTPADYGAIDLLHVYYFFSIIIFGGEIIQAITRFLPEEADAGHKKKFISTSCVFLIASFAIYSFINFIFGSRLSFL
jgi:O-antigen/teichoic acid export membrane protein